MPKRIFFCWLCFSLLRYNHTKGEIGTLLVVSFINRCLSFFFPITLLQNCRPGQIRHVHQILIHPLLLLQTLKVLGVDFDRKDVSLKAKPEWFTELYSKAHGANPGSDGKVPLIQVSTSAHSLHHLWYFMFTLLPVFLSGWRLSSLRICGSSGVFSRKVWTFQIH